MAVLYIISLEKGMGKTTICAGLGKHLMDDGKKVVIGYESMAIGGSEGYVTMMAKEGD